MTEKLQKIATEEILKLPEENQEAINALAWGEISEEIGKKYLFTESEINDLQVETMLVLISFEDPALYAINIEDNIGTTKEEAGKISAEVFEKIFMPINNALLESIKKSDAVKNPSFGQTLDFILSGGDYSAFMEKKEDVKIISPDDQQDMTQPQASPSIARKIPADSEKITDMKDKFVI